MRTIINSDLLRIFRLKIGPSGNIYPEPTATSLDTSASRVKFPSTLLVPVGRQHDKRKVEKVTQGVTNPEPFNAIVRDVKQRHMKVLLFGNVDRCMRHVIGHILYKGAPAICWYVLFEYLNNRLRWREPTLEDCILYGVLTSSPNRRDAIGSWDQSLRPVYRVLRGHVLSPSICSILGLQRTASALDAVTKYLDVPKSLMSLPELLSVTEVVVRQSDTTRRDPERDSLLFDPKFVGRPSDPTGTQSRDRARKEPDLETGLVGTDPISKLIKCAEAWKIVLSSEPFPTKVSEAARVLLILESLTDERIGNLRNFYRQGGNLEEN